MPHWSDNTLTSIFHPQESHHFSLFYVRYALIILYFKIVFPLYLMIKVMDKVME